MVVGAILIVINGITQYIAWVNIQKYFSEKQDIYDKQVTLSFEEGAGKIKIASVIWIFSFLVIPAIIAAIVYILGYFQIGGAFSKPEQAIQPTAPTPARPTPQVSRSVEPEKIESVDTAQEKIMKQLVGYVKVYKKINLPELMEILKISKNELKKILFELVAENKISGEFTDDDNFRVDSLNL